MGPSDMEMDLRQKVADDLLIEKEKLAELYERRRIASHHPKRKSKAKIARASRKRNRT